MTAYNDEHENEYDLRHPKTPGLHEALEAATREAKTWGWATEGPAFSAVLKAFAEALPSPNGSGEVSEASIQRYGEPICDDIGMQESADGEWVKFKDVADICARNAKLERLSASMAGPVPEGWNGSEQDWKLLYAATPEQIETSLQSQRAKLTNLPENWDGYGAHPLPAEIVDTMLSEITVEGGVVDLVPGADGSIQAEWHRRGDVDVEYLIGADGKRSLYVKVAPAPALPEAKPVATGPEGYLWKRHGFDPWAIARELPADATFVVPLYASPVQVEREGADDPAEELRKRLETMHGDQLRYFFGMGRFEGVPDEELRKTILAFFYPASRTQP